MDLYILAKVPFTFCVKGIKYRIGRAALLRFYRFSLRNILFYWMQSLQ